MTLILHLHGPMQSWGSAARFGQRTTSLLPTKSGVVGFLAAADGRKRGTDISDITALRMTVRVDTPGVLMRDYHTVGAGYPKGQRLRSAEGKERDAAILTERYYLAGATFTVGLEGDELLLTRLEKSLRAPAWPLALGRRACPPGDPYLIGIDNRDAMTLLHDTLPIVRWATDGSLDQWVHFQSEDPTGSLMSFADQPTKILNKWDTYTHRSVLDSLDELPAERFTDDRYALIEALASSTPQGERQ